MDPETIESAPGAHSCEWYRCDHCDDLHLIAYDHADQVIATAVLSRDMLRDMLAVAYGVAPERAPRPVLHAVQPVKETR